MVRRQPHEAWVFNTLGVHIGYDTRYLSDMYLVLLLQFQFYKIRIKTAYMAWILLCYQKVPLLLRNSSSQTCDELKWR